MPSDPFDFGPDLLAGPTATDGVRLRADALPTSTWGSNLRGILSPKEWDTLRRAVVDAAVRRCEICGRPGVPRGPLHCHEKWVFEIVERIPVQRLERLVALCVACHRVQHVGLAGVRGEMALVKSQLTKVNKWGLPQVIADLARAQARSHLLEQLEWDLDLRVLTGQANIKGWPDLYILASGRPYLGNAYRPGMRPRPV